MHPFINTLVSLGRPRELGGYSIESLTTEFVAQVKQLDDLVVEFGTLTSRFTRHFDKYSAYIHRNEGNASKVEQAFRKVAADFNGTSGALDAPLAKMEVAQVSLGLSCLALLDKMEELKGADASDYEPVFNTIVKFGQELAGARHSVGSIRETCLDMAQNIQQHRTSCPHGGSQLYWEPPRGRGRNDSGGSQ